MSGIPQGGRRAAVFVDGANFYRALRQIRVRAIDIDIEKVARKLAEDRELVGIFYFIARVARDAGAPYEANLRLIEDLSARPRVHLFLGFLQSDHEANPCAEELEEFIRSSAPRALSDDARRRLRAIAARHAMRRVFREKGVDVALAIQMVRQAQLGTFDLAYLMSADGDFYPAVDLVRRMGRSVIVASPIIGRRLRESCNATLLLDRVWFRDCRS